MLHWINDGLMAVFFLLVGLEIKREVLDGQLRGASRIVLPGIAALGGMIMPALIYVLINWAAPAAARLGHSRRHRHRLRTGHPAAGQPRADLAQDLPDRAGHPDDLGAIIIIALFYTSQLNLFALGMAAALLAILFCLNRAGVLRLTPYLLLGAVLWYFVLKSGVHATLAGVALALAIPLRLQNQGAPAAHSRRCTRWNTRCTNPWRC